MKKRFVLFAGSVILALPIIFIVIPSRHLEMVSSLFPANLGRYFVDPSISKGLSDFFRPEIFRNNTYNITSSLSVGILIFFDRYENYSDAVSTVMCYAKSRGYPLVTITNINVTKDTIHQQCSSHRNLFFWRHCAASVVVRDFDWLLFIDGDTGVINPNHRIEEYIDSRMDLIFYERYVTGEIMAGNYLVKNNRNGRNFLQKWADYEFIAPKPPVYTEQDQGPLHLLIVEALLPENKTEILHLHQLLNQSRSSPIIRYADFYGEAARIIQKQRSKITKSGLRVKIFHRAQGFARDIRSTGRLFTDFDFLNHQMKYPNYYPLAAHFQYSDDVCSNPNWFPALDQRKNVTRGKFVGELKKFSVQVNTRGHEFYMRFRHYLPPTHECWPSCENYLDYSDYV